MNLATFPGSGNLWNRDFHHRDDADAFDEAVDALLIDDFDPYAPRNFGEAIGEAPDAVLASALQLLRDGDFIAAGLAFQTLTCTYWRTQAEAVVEKKARNRSDP